MEGLQQMNDAVITDCISSIMEQCTTMNSHVRTIKTKKDELKMENDQLKKKNKSLTKNLAAATTKNLVLQRDISDLQQISNFREELIENLQKNLESANDEFERVITENVVIQQQLESKKIAKFD